MKCCLCLYLFPDYWQRSEYQVNLMTCCLRWKYFWFYHYRINILIYIYDNEAHQSTCKRPAKCILQRENFYSTWKFYQLFHKRQWRAGRLENDWEVITELSRLNANSWLNCTYNSHIVCKIIFYHIISHFDRVRVLVWPCHFKEFRFKYNFY